jgi:acetylornithine deacetylase
MIFRTVSDIEQVREQLAILVAEHGGEITLARGNAPQFMVVPEGEPSAVVAFNSDIPHLGALGKPLLFGPGSILDAHGPNERIAKRELIAAVETYAKVVAGLLGS